MYKRDVDEEAVVRIRQLNWFDRLIADYKWSDDMR